MKKESIAEYIVYLISPFAPHATCEFTTDDMGTLFMVTVPQEEKGRVIGRAGETINAIRHIVAIVGYQAGIRASIKVA